MALAFAVFVTGAHWEYSVNSLWGLRAVAFELCALQVRIIEVGMANEYPPIRCDEEKDISGAVAARIRYWPPQNR